MNAEHAYDYEEWGWIHTESMPGEYKVEISKDGVMTCDSPEVRVGRGKIGLIKVSLRDRSEQEFELVPLIFEDQERIACTQRLLKKKEILIIDDNCRGEGEAEERIKFSVIAKSRSAERALYLDPIVINE